jgi:hypothetical protein
MSVEQLSALNLRYVDLSNRFKAAWAFHQFLQAQNRVFPNGAPATDPLSFQRIYADIKSITTAIHAGAQDGLEKKLDSIAAMLAERYAQLVEVDETISPAQLRQFFERLDPFDDRGLAQLVRFYILAHQGSELGEDGVDKVDFLGTRLGERLLELDRPAIERDGRRFHEVVAGLWRTLQAEQPTSERLDAIRVELAEIRDALGRAEGLDDLHQLGILPRYRSLKHDLGWFYFYPDILMSIVDTNLRLRARVESWYANEERRIVEECRDLLDRESEVAGPLGGEVESFRDEVAALQRKIDGQNVKLRDLQEIHDKVRRLAPRLRATSSGGFAIDLPSPIETAVKPARQISPALPPEPLSTIAVNFDPGMLESTGIHGLVGLQEAGSGSRLEDSSERDLADTGEIAVQELVPQKSRQLRLRTANAELLGAQLMRLLAALERIDPRVAPGLAVNEAGVAEMRLEAREIVAYRRLVNPVRCDEKREQMILEGAALRLEIVATADMLLGISSESSSGFESGRRRGAALCRLADEIRLLLERLMQDAVIDEDHEEARHLLVLRMRMTREWTGLWLLVHRRQGGVEAP